ncbi:prepilin-type N-terminal cleavage/methylation domain-containing protein [Patescibacteria group bacterium]|nr:prepilin-type N-terminal cleavage/methylation domain-containing protein [Patescibacteria group bacterium]MCL5409939.1 prepilin-type N-terminal cleavage/methylation domain-containing protein [Patescibacteria group bacterium]
MQINRSIKSGLKFLHRGQNNTGLKCVNTGFTLVEMLVAVAVLGVIMIIISDILLQTLRGENKVQTLNQVKQNGQSVMDKLSLTIRESQQVMCISGDGQTIVVHGLSSDSSTSGLYTKFAYHSPTVSTNGYISREDFTDIPVHSDTSLPYSDSELCTSPVSGTLINLSDPNDLKNGVSFVQESSGANIFTPVSSSGYRDVILIRYAVKEAISAGQVFESSVNSSGVQFETSVMVRGSQF